MSNKSLKEIVDFHGGPALMEYEVLVSAGKRAQDLFDGLRSLLESWTHQSGAEAPAPETPVVAAAMIPRRAGSPDWHLLHRDSKKRRLQVQYLLLEAKGEGSEALEAAKQKAAKAFRVRGKAAEKLIKGMMIGLGRRGDFVTNFIQHLAIGRPDRTVEELATLYSKAIGVEVTADQLKKDIGTAKRRAAKQVGVMLAARKIPRKGGARKKAKPGRK